MDPPRRPPAEPYGWWGYQWHAPEPLSIVALIAAGSLDARTAALLWLALERRASLVVAAQAQHAGKTTTLTALAEFLPPATRRVYLRGWGETFAFLGTADPGASYLLCNEISAHLPVYLWGPRVARLFDAVATGYGLGTTMHADNLDELSATLEGPPLAVPRAAPAPSRVLGVARLDFLLVLAVDYVERRPRRRLHTLALLRRSGAGDDFDPATLVRWDTARGDFVHAPDPPPPGLSRRAGLSAAMFVAERERRAAYLGDLAARGVRAVHAVRRALAAYRPAGV
ncbi:MAG TPA: type II secretion system protein E [Thermomicrobiales bacterium]|nr:type II secretion system protein E [Thermomicrobiales bacterium]